MPEQDPPEFDWLYGQGPRKTPPAEEAEPTRVMPRPDVGRQGGRGEQHPHAPHRPAPASGPPMATPPKKRRTGRRIRRIVLLLVVAWVAFLIAVPVMAWKKIDKVDAAPAGARPDEQPGTTYLLVGSDSRKGLSRAEKRRMGTGGVGDVGQRTDTIMLLHIGDGPTLLLSIPRDSIVPIPDHGTTKINAAFAYGGPKLLVRTIEQSTGVRIDHYVEIGFGGFVNSVDAVGGIEICPTQRMVDPRANLKIKKGCQQADGVTALGYSRSRHTSPIGDIDRAKHQREVVAAIGAEVKSPWTVINPWRYSAVMNAGTSSLKISEGTGPIDLARFAWAMTKVNGSGGLTCSMPIRDLAVHWDRDRALALLGYIKTDNTGDIPRRLCQPTGLPE